MAGPSSSGSFVPTPPPTDDIFSEQRTLYLSREGRELEIDLQHVSPSAVARVFEVDVSTVWLRERNGQRAFFPDSTNSRFLFANDVGVMCFRFEVEGSHAPVGIGSSSNPNVVAPPARQASLPRNPLIAHTKKTGPMTNVKVVQAEMKKNYAGKIEFFPISSAYFDLTDTTANVQHLNQAVQQKWGEGNVIVSADGLRIEDSPGTQGIKFWRVGSRKVFAVKRSDLFQKKRLKSDDEELQVEESTVVQSDLVNEIKAMKQTLDSITKVSNSMHLPLALRRMLMETFSCHICRSILKPPVIFTKCCRYILGCQQCVDTWYCGEDGRNKQCPRCRAERGFAETCQIYGLDEFLCSMGHYLGDSHDDGEEMND